MRKRLNLSHEKPKIILAGPVPPPLGGVSVHIQREKALLEKAAFICSYAPLGGWFGNKISVINVTNALIGTLTAFFKCVFTSYSALHLHYSRWFYSLPVLIAVRVKKVSYAVTFHSTSIQEEMRHLPMYAVSMFVRLLSAADLTISVSKRVEESLVELGAKSNQRAVVIPAFLAPTAEEKSPNALTPHGFTVYRSIAEKKGKVIMAAAYNLGRGYATNDVYGIEFLSRTISEMQFSEKVSLVICVSKRPNGPEQRLAEKTISELFDSSEVDLHFVYGEPMLPFLCISDAFVRPSRIDGDSIALREAITLGVPSAASSVVDRPNEVILFEMTDSSLAKAIVLLIECEHFTQSIVTESEYQIDEEIRKIITPNEPQ